MNDEKIPQKFIFIFNIYIYLNVKLINVVCFFVGVVGKLTSKVVFLNIFWDQAKFLPSAWQIAWKGLNLLIPKEPTLHL